MPKIEHYCNRCNRKFLAHKCSNRKYCSKKCSASRPLSDSAKNKISGINNVNWKGDNVGYSSAHYRVTKKFGKARICEICGSNTLKKYDWANLTGKYHDVNDYKQMCRSCHKKYDYKVNKDFINNHINYLKDIIIYLNNVINKLEKGESNGKVSR